MIMSGAATTTSETTHDGTSSGVIKHVEHILHSMINGFWRFQYLQQTPFTSINIPIDILVIISAYFPCRLLYFDNDVFLRLQNSQKKVQNYLIPYISVKCIHTKYECTVLSIDYRYIYHHRHLYASLFLTKCKQNRLNINFILFMFPNFSHTHLKIYQEPLLEEENEEMIQRFVEILLPSIQYITLYSPKLMNASNTDRKSAKTKYSVIQCENNNPYHAIASQRYRMEERDILELDVFSFAHWFMKYTNKARVDFFGERYVLRYIAVYKITGEQLYAKSQSELNLLLPWNVYSYGNIQAAEFRMVISNSLYDKLHADSSEMVTSLTCDGLVEYMKRFCAWFIGQVFMIENMDGATFCSLSQDIFVKIVCRNIGDCSLQVKAIYSQMCLYISPRNRKVLR